MERSFFVLNVNGVIFLRDIFVDFFVGYTTGDSEDQIT